MATSRGFNRAPRKLLDVSGFDLLGRNAAIPLPDGLTSTYAWYLANQDTRRS